MLTLVRKSSFTMGRPDHRILGVFIGKSVERGLLGCVEGAKDGPARITCVLSRVTSRSMDLPSRRRSPSSGISGIAALAALALSSLTACGADELRGTEGQLGTLHFEYTTAGVCDGCAVDREILPGSILDVDMHRLHPRVGVLVRSTSPDVAEFQLASRCRFVGQDHCRDGVVVTAKAAGDADLEVYDDWTGTVLDRVTIKVRDAASLETVVKATHAHTGVQTLAPAPDGTYEVEVDSDVEILAKPVSASGSYLIATSAAIKSAYPDADVLAPRSVESSAAPAEYAKAKSPGVASVALVGGAARSELAFRVLQ